LRAKIRDVGEFWRKRVGRRVRRKLRGASTDNGVTSPPPAVEEDEEDGSRRQLLRFH